jgi:hypothetical protein
MAARDDQLQEILSRLTTIAYALATDTPPPRTPATPEQSTTILDYLVLREVAGRRADETSRVVSAVRRVGGVIAFPDTDQLDDATRVAVFTKRGTPAEIPTLEDSGDEEVGSPLERTVTLGVVTDTQPIIRIEIRRDDDIAIALGPRLAAVG